MEDYMTTQTSLQSNKTYTQDQLKEIVFVPSKESLPKIERKEEITSLTHTDLHDTLLYIQDVLERSQIPFIVVGDLARQMLREDTPTLVGDKVEVVVLRKYITESTGSFLKTFLRLVGDIEDKIETDYNNTPIVIHVIDKDYPFFRNPDTRFYYITEFRFPNPFEDYWKEKDNI